MNRINYRRCWAVRTLAILRRGVGPVIHRDGHVFPCQVAADMELFHWQRPFIIANSVNRNCRRTQDIVFLIGKRVICILHQRLGFHRLIRLEHHLQAWLDDFVRIFRIHSIPSILLIHNLIPDDVYNARYLNIILGIASAKVVCGNRICYILGSCVMYPIANNADHIAAHGNAFGCFNLL